MVAQNSLVICNKCQKHYKKLCCACKILFLIIENNNQTTIFIAIYRKELFFKL